MSGEQMLICLVGWDCLAQAAAVRLAEIHPSLQVVFCQRRSTLDTLLQLEWTDGQEQKV